MSSERPDPEFTPGVHAVRAVCPGHPDTFMRLRLSTDGTVRTGWCGTCTHAVDLCPERFGSKECVREKGHAGMHVSPSGSGWPQESVAPALCGNRTRRDGVVYTCTVARPDGHRGRHSCRDDRTRAWVEWTDADSVQPQRDAVIMRCPRGAPSGEPGWTCRREAGHSGPCALDPDAKADPDATMPAKPSSNAKIPALCGNRNDEGGPVWTCSLARGHLGAHECWNAIGTQRVIWTDAEGEPPKAAPVKAVEPDARMHAAMVESLEKTLARAKAGELRGLVVVTYDQEFNLGLLDHTQARVAEVLGLIEVAKTIITDRLR